MTIPETTATRMARPQQRTLWQRIPWLWYDYVVARSRAPLWLLSLIPFAINYGIGILLALLAGELPKFLGDLRYLGVIGWAFPGSLILGYAPRALDRFWASIKPWLANSEEEVSGLQARTPEILLRFFWITVLLIFGSELTWAFLGPETGNWAYDYARPEYFKFLLIPTSIVGAYFVGGGLCVTSMGIWLFAQRIGQALDFKQGFLLHGGKATLQPFNQLLWLIWGMFVLPSVVMVGVVTALTAARAPLPYIIATSLLFGLLFGLSIVLPQYFMNRLLAKEKAEELRTLQQELTELASLPNPKEPLETLPRMFRHQHLVYQIQQTQAFTPTLVDTRFVIQIATSITAIILATILANTLGLR